MPTIKLNRKNVAGLLPAARVVTYFDTDVPGLGLRIMPTGTRSWVLEYRPGAGGRGVAKRRIKIGGTEMSPEDAKAAALDMLAAIRQGGDPAAERRAERAAETVGELCDAYLARHVEPKRKGRTAAYYKQLIESHIRPALGAKRAVTVSREDVDRFHRRVASPSKEGRGGRTAANRALTLLSGIYNWAGEMNLVPEGCNPCGRVEKFKEQAKERYLTAEELTRLGAALREAETIGLPHAPSDSKHAPKVKNRTTLSPHATGAIRLLLLTGCRLREILNLRWVDFDDGRGVLFLPDSKTGKKTVVLSSAAQDVLKGLPRVGAYVIASTDPDRPRSDLKKPWAAISARAGLTGVRLHDLRHTFASVGAAAGMSLPVIGGLLGHADAATTQRYAHLHVDPVRAAADAIASRIAEAIDKVGE
ncbi:site-specific integrase [Ancylobacter sp. 6x-1]|uniref:Site-specific integrase n=1 Tax=Ancylobacter crimeensis TaxID=2579147 RepID=A0ABT0DCQ2_9HYPH|nr:site-specific integrase [Ancylobacter crimeensis]MCK0197740.1 site-specific integrase [Ancylobacter crimeensis]